MTKDQLNEIRARCELTPEGPWFINKATLGIFCGTQRIATTMGFDKEIDIKRRNNAEFIAHAREDIPALLEVIRDLKLRLEIYQVHNEAIFHRFGGNDDE